MQGVALLKKIMAKMLNLRWVGIVILAVILLR
ncbi:hypothetical protein LCGC14_3100180, partial [marine sediment metagenome]